MLPALAIASVLAAVSVAADGACLDPAALTLTLESALAVAQGDRLSALDVQVIAAPSGPGLTAISLTASARGEIVLARQFSLAQPDCAQGGDLLEAVLARFLDGFPRERWTDPVAEPIVPRKGPRRRWGITPRGGADLGLLPSPEDPLIADTSGDFEIAIAPERSGASIEALLRQGTWSNVGKGRYQPVTFLVGAGWALMRGHERSAHAGVRSGVLVIRGDRNSDPISEKLLPWVEVYGDIAWKAGPVRIGPQFAFSLIRVDAETEDGANRRVVPTNRIGMRIEIPL